ncbi:MAG: amidohydrolase family protein [Planctomycetota bacterium]|nr:amidohydrolase family protein [Planctomycetota bacterium]
MLKICRLLALAVLPTVLPILLSGAPPGAQEPETPGEGLRLEDFSPKSMLRVAEHPVARARFPVIDFHGHLSRARPEQTIRVMDACNVRMVVDFDGGFGERFERQKERFAAHPGRFVHFARLEWRTIDDPDFSTKAALQLEADVKAGARGLKISKALGLYVRDRAGKLIAVNDRRLDAVWAKCGELGIPVVIHTADPDAFFLPVDGKNEQYEALVRRPNWSFHGRDFPSKETLLKQRNEVIERHPKTTFVGLHVANRSEDLSEVSALLDRRPNLHVEFGARVNELGRQPYTARKFFLKYQDRILFGLDRNPPSAYHYRVYFRFLETWDEHFDYAGRQGLGRWKIYGIGLPDSVLKKVYSENALKLLGIEE